MNPLYMRLPEMQDVATTFCQNQRPLGNNVKTVAQGFREFQTQLTTPENESYAAKKHRSSIEACLKERFNLEAFFQSGSFGNGTNIPVHSDVDRFAVIPRENLSNNPRAVLRAVRIALSRRFPTTVGIKIDPPAVVIPFGVLGIETTDIIPAIDAGSHAGHNVYAIPDPANLANWILSSPQAIRSRINEIDSAHDKKLKPLIRSLKVWKYRRKVPIQSIYLELACTTLASESGLLTTSIDIARVLHRMRSNNLSVFHDPYGLGAPIKPTHTSGQVEMALRKVNGGAAQATRAVVAEIENRVKPAFNIWKFFFGSRFPNPE